MKRNTQIIISIISFTLGTLGVFINPLISLAGLFIFIAAIFLATDYNRAVYVLAFFFVIDYVIRNFLSIAALSGIWDELFLIAALLLFLIKYIFEIDKQKHIFTPIDLPMLVFILVNLFILIANSTYIEVGIEGFRAVTTNLLWFFLVFSLLKNEKSAKKALTFVVIASLILAIYGIYQYIAGVEMPAGWVDQAEQGVRTRAFSLVQSPNILGSIMTLTSMVSLGLFFYDKKIFNKAFYALAFITMTLCLVVTLSRGAWIGYGMAVIVFILFKDKKYLIPIAAIGIIAILFIPAISSRVLYMLSPEYLASSLTAGRMQRWIEGFALFKSNFLFGTGLGHFGGAVASHYPHYFPNAFYMDNYFLKIAVESGILGIISFFALIYVTLSTVFKSSKHKKNTPKGDLLLSLFAGLLGVSIHCFFENIFEVPGMIILFWMVAAIAMVLIYKDNSRETI